MNPFGRFDFWYSIARRLPRKLVYACFQRAFVEYSAAHPREVVPDITFDAAGRWAERWAR